MRLTQACVGITGTHPHQGTVALNEVIKTVRFHRTGEKDLGCISWYEVEEWICVLKPWHWISTARERAAASMSFIAFIVVSPLAPPCHRMNSRHKSQLEYAQTRQIDFFLPVDMAPVPVADVSMPHASGDRADQCTFSFSVQSFEEDARLRISAYVDLAFGGTDGDEIHLLS